MGWGSERERGQGEMAVEGAQLGGGSRCPVLPRRRAPRRCVRQDARRSPIVAPGPALTRARAEGCAEDRIVISRGVRIPHYMCPSPTRAGRSLPCLLAGDAPGRRRVVGRDLALLADDAPAELVDGPRLALFLGDRLERVGRARRRRRRRRREQRRQARRDCRREAQVVDLRGESNATYYGQSAGPAGERPAAADEGAGDAP